MAYSKKKKDKPEEVADEWHSKLVTWVNEADEATSDSRELSEKSRDYYDSIQTWNSSERAFLAKRKQPCVVINRIKPKMDALMGMEKAAKTTAKAFPRTPKHEKGAEASTESIRFVLQDNSFDQIRSACWENILIEGTCGAEVIVESGEGDEMRVTINHLMWDRLIYDPHSRTKDFNPKTCRYLGQVVWLDYDVAAARFPAGKDVLEAQQSGSSTHDDKPRWMDNTRRRCKVVELYYQRDGDVWYACFTRGGFLKSPQKSPYINEEGETEWPYEFASAFVTREGDRYGPCKQLLDVQDEINKRRAKALHLMSVRQTFGTKGAVEDLNAARKELARPDGHVEFAYGEFGKDFGILPTGDMAKAQFDLLTEAKMEIDAVGANAATQGKDKTIQSGRALIERRNAGQTEVGPIFDVLRHWQYRIFRKVWNRIRQYWKAEKWIRVTDDEHNLRWVGLNAPITKGQMLLEQAQEQGLPPEQLQQMQAQIQSDPSMQEVVDTKNILADLDVDIIISEVPDVLTQQSEDWQGMTEMVKSGFPLPPLAVIEASPFASSTKEKMIKQMKESPQIPPQVQEQMEQLKEAGQKALEEAQRLTQENQALKADTQGEQAKLQLQAQSEQAKLAADMERTQAELSLKREVQAAELQLERERAAATIELERMKAQAQLELQGMKMDGDQKQQSAKLAFDQECRAKDEEAKRTEQAKAEEAPLTENVMPKFLDAMKAMMDTFSKSIEEQAKFNVAIVAELKKPKRIELGNIRRGDDGLLDGASATVQ